MNKFAPGNLALPVARWFFKKYTEDKIMGYYLITLCDSIFKFNKK